jgi:xylulokinase
MDILKEMGLKIEAIKVGNDNLFQSSIFARSISTLTGASIKVLDTTGAVGAALAAGVGAGHFTGFQEAMANLQIVREITPDQEPEDHQKAYGRWKDALKGVLTR